MTTIYLDLFSGISGDMFIGAMLDLGVDFHKFEHEMEKLGLDGYHLHAGRAQRGLIAGTKFDVHLAPAHHHHHDDPPHHHLLHPLHSHEHGHNHSHDEQRNFAQIRQLIQASRLSDWVKEKSLAVFARVAAAEGKIHGLPPDQVHFHEVGAVDSIVDIVGACVALELLGQPRLLASPVIDGTGWVDCAHGRFPVPAPATLEILAARGVPISQCEEPHELVTPTGAALLAELVEEFGPMREFTPRQTGFGLGTRENKTRPNVLRAILGGSSALSTHDWETDTIAVLETNLDDVSPEVIGYVVEKAFHAGALDVFQTPIQMKKNRAGTLLTILCKPDKADSFCELLLRETSAFGIRRTLAERRKLRREFITVKTAYGEVTVKLGRLDGKVVQTAPEFESCKKLAAEKGVPFKAVFEAATRAANPGS